MPKMLQRLGTAKAAIVVKQQQFFFPVRDRCFFLNAIRKYVSLSSTTLNSEQRAYVVRLCCTRSNPEVGAVLRGFAQQHVPYMPL